MRRSEAQAEAKYGATFCLALQRISNNRNFPQAKHNRTRCGQRVPKGQPEYAHSQSQALTASGYSGAV
jgi:hypothetical protein